MMNEKLVNRLNRVSGQIEAIKKRVENGADEDCIEVLQQLKASINALKKFGEAYVSDHMSACMKQDMSKDEIQDNLRKVISGAFSL